MPLPWTSAQADKIGNSGPSKPMKGEKAVAGKKLSEEEMKRLKATLFKPVDSKVSKKEDVKSAPEKKKGFFGLF